MPTRSKLKPSDFVHLHNHSEYSVLDGLTKLKPLVERIKHDGMEAIAITDHGTLSGAIDFYKEATNANVKPIVGIETYVAARGHTDKDPGKDKARYHLILLAMNATGYKNLMKLSSIANLEGFYYFPRIDHDLIKKYNEGLICLSACMSGEVGDALGQGQYDKAKKVAAWYKSVFGDRYYLEVQDHGHPKNPMVSEEQTNVNEQIFKLSKDLDIEVALTCDAHYLNKSDEEAHEVLLCVGTASYLDEANRMSLSDFPLFVETPDQLIKRWGEEHPEVILNTKKIADRCDLKIKLGEILIPKFDVPKGESEQTYLTGLVYQGLAVRYGGVDRKDAEKMTLAQAKQKISKEIITRAEYELSVIKAMGFDGYFLIIADFVTWGKDRGIVFGPGRGSAAGSIISYALRITEIDPLAYDLLFERFLNPDRISMPDVDIDIQDNRREEVIDYCVQKYGRDRVANIVTFGRMFARNAVRDVARVLRVPYGDADHLAKMLPAPIQGRHIPLATTLKENADLKNEYRSNEVSKRVLDLAVKLEGTIRSHGVHAAGVVIAPDDIVSFVPLEMAQKGVVATQYSLGPIEELGLLKMDFLGLSNLTIIKNCLRIVKRVYQDDIDISKLPLDDKKTLELFVKGNTTGVFQFESTGMRRYLKELKPTEFEDLIAMNALYRPGPMQWIDDFIARKNGKKEIEYLHESMQPSLENTYGVIVYQEQVMQISREMCGFTGGESDTLRKAIAKKKPEELAKIKSAFIEGAIKTVNADRKLMEKFWTQLEAFAAYCFPKAHAACYAIIAYQTAYLKAHYPDAFMAAVMTSDYDNIDRLAIEITECKHLGIEVLQPDVNESFLEFAVVPGANKIRFGLLAIKNVGTGAVAEVLRARGDEPFTSLENFFSRVDTRIVNRKALDSLIKAGAFDNFGDRNYLLANLDNLLSFSARRLKDQSIGQTDLFGNVDGTQSVTVLKINLEGNYTPATDSQRLSWERELIGLYLSQHPLESYQEILADSAYPITEIINSMKEGQEVYVGGVISSIREITTKNGSKMAFVKIEDGQSDVELIFFPSIYQKEAEKLERDTVIIARGKLSTRGKSGAVGDEPKILVDELRVITPEEASSYKPAEKPRSFAKSSALVAGTTAGPEIIESQRLFIRLQNSQDQSLLMLLKQTIDDHAGDTDVVLVLGPTDNKQIIKLPMKILTDDVSLNKLKDLVGNENIKIS